MQYSQATLGLNYGLLLLSQQISLDSTSTSLFSFARVILEDLIHLLQRLALGLRDKEECPYEGQ